MQLKKIWKALKLSFKDFFDENILKFSASLSYSTVFAIGPLLLIIISLIGFFFGNRESAQDRILNQFSGILGSNVTQQLDQILNSFNDGDNGIIGIITGSIILIIGATSVFMERFYQYYMACSDETRWHLASLTNK